VRPRAFAAGTRATRAGIELRDAKKLRSAIDFAQLYAGWPGKLAPTPGVPVAEVAPSIRHVGVGRLDLDSRGERAPDAVTPKLTERASGTVTRPTLRWSASIRHGLSSPGPSRHRRPRLLLRTALRRPTSKTRYASCPYAC
jgi:hypothetical protein